MNRGNYLNALDGSCMSQVTDLRVKHHWGMPETMILVSHSKRQTSHPDRVSQK